MNYFELLSLPINYEIDLKLLYSNYHKLQMQFHPDKFAHESEQMRRLAVQKSSEINDAYTTLKNPIKRGEYLLTVLTDERLGNITLKDSAFLMQQFTWREELSILKNNFDENKYESLKNTSNSFNKGLFTELINLFETNSLDKVAEILMKLKFMEKFFQELDQIEDYI